VCESITPLPKLWSASVRATVHSRKRPFMLGWCVTEGALPVVSRLLAYYVLACA